MGRRSDNLDVIRAIAALGVIIFHLPQVALAQFTLPVSMAVWTLTDGVPLFFVLSGYLLTVLMPQNDRHHYPVASFYLKRFFRIAPMFYFALALWIIRSGLVGNGLPSIATVAATASLLFNLLPKRALSYVGAGWTVGAEIIFYLLFPFLYRVTRTLAGFAVTFAVALVVCENMDRVIMSLPYDHARLVTYTLVALPRHLPVFLLGVGCARLLPVIKASAHYRILGLCITLATVAAGCLLVQNNNPLFVARHWREAAAALLFLGLSLLLPERGLRPLAFIGRISYSMYLLHLFVILSLAPVYVAILGLGFGAWASILLGFVATLVVLVPISYVSYFLIEEKGIGLGSRLIKYFDTRKEPSIPVVAEPVPEKASVPI